MKHIFFLLSFLLVLAVPVAFAERGETTFDGTTQDGKTIIGRGLTPWIFDGQEFQPYLFTDGATKKIETNYGSVILNADGSYSFYKKGKINSAELFTDEIVAKYADVSDLNSWTYLNSLNNDTPDISWDGTELVSRKTSAAGILEYKYILNDGSWKTQLEATNLSALTTKAFGFDQIVDINSDTIKFGGINRNLDNFNGQTFGKQFLVDNEGKVLDLLNGFNFDFDLGFENLYSITVYDTGAGKSRLVFDYRTSTRLLPNETLIIDPTVTQNTGGTTSFVYDATQTFVGMKFETSSAALLGTTIDSFDAFLLKSGSPTGFATARIYDGAGVLRETSTNSLDVSTLTGAMVQHSFTFAGTRVIAEDDFLGIFYNSGTGVDLVGVDRSATDVYDSTNTVLGRYISSAWNALSTADMRFVLVYTNPPPAPDSITDLTADSVGTTTASLSFTPPNLNGETLINYMLNVTTPQQDTPPSTFWMNGSASPFSVVGLSQGTSYSASASAYTAGGGNWTLANVLNFTTSSNPIACCAPTNLVASSNSATQIDLQWVASTLQNLNGYRIERETPIGTGFNVIVANTSSTNVFYNNTGLTSNIIYNYRVYGLNGTGQSIASNVYDMTTFHLPDAVTDLTGTATDLSTIDLSWSAPTSYAPEIQGYQINGTTPTGEPVDILNANTGSDATTATAFNLLIGQEYSFRVAPITVHGTNASGNIWNGSTIQTFVIGDLSSPDVTNDDDFSIFFERTDLNSSAIQLDVTYPNSYNLSCDFAYKYARINQTYSGLTTVPDGADDQTATFTLVNATGDLVQVRCWDPATGDESKYVITITSFPFLEQVQALRNGDYGTFFQIGAFDGVMLVVIFLGMIGLNRTTPIVGIVFVVITTLALSYFGLITYPVIMYPALIMMIVWAFVTTRKDD